MKKIRFEQILQEREGTFIEFKSSFSSSLAKEIVAFANTAGGRIFISVDDNNNVVDASLTNDMRSRIQDICNSCTPRVPLQIDKFFTVIFHRPSDSPGSAFVQVKAQEAQAEAQEAHAEIRNKLTKSEIMILEMCMNEPASSKDIQLGLGIKRSGSFKNSLTKLLKMGLLSQKIPDKTSSPKQKYITTELTKSIIKLDKEAHEVI